MVTTVGSTDVTDEQLAVEAAREDSNGPAFMALLERHRGRVWRLCYRLMGNEPDANDAAQEVFIRLFLQRARFAGHSTYVTWLHSVTVRTCLALRRSRGRRQRRETAVPEAEWQRQTATATEPMSMDVTKMLETLDDEDRALVVLKYAEGYSYEELSAIFDLSVSACKMRISRARDKLREQFSLEAETGA